MHELDGTVHVLHVDDEPGFAELAATFVERQTEDVEVHPTTSASDGLDQLDEGVDCVVSDYDMPGMDGIEFLRAVRREYPELPFILFTGRGSEEIASEAISAGVTDYLQKGSGTEHYAILANRITNYVERNRAQDDRRRYVRRLETLIDNLPGIVYRCRNEPGWPMEYLNGDVESLTGYEAHEIEQRDGLYGDDVIHPEDRDRVWETVQEAVEAGSSFEVTYRIRTQDDDRKWVWERGQEVSASTGDTEILEGFITDITDLKEARRALTEEREFITQAIDSLDDLFYVVDCEGRIQRWNDRVVAVTGYQDEELEDLPATELVPEDEREATLATIRETLETGHAVTEIDVQTANGARRTYEFNGSRLTDTTGTTVGLVGIGRELVDRT